LPDAIADTSPLQYLHQIGKLALLTRLFARVVIPPAVAAEIADGRKRGVNLPDPVELNWIDARPPADRPALPFGTALGPGESAVLALGAEHPDAILLLDDGVARRAAQQLGLQFTGTLGLLVAATKAGAIDAISPLLDAPQACRFRAAARGRRAVLQLAGEQ